MPRTTLYLYAEEDGGSPVLDWFAELNRIHPRAVDACIARVRLLGALGHELRRPYADALRSGIHELRARAGNVQCRLLYFFHGQNVVVVAHGLTKEAAVPASDIERAIERRRRYERDPEKHRATLNL